MLRNNELHHQLYKLVQRVLSVCWFQHIHLGGCVETSKPTTHAEPTYIVDDVVHYCVANMPGGVPRTSTIALNNATLPFLSKLEKDGPAFASLLKKGKVALFNDIVEVLGTPPGMFATQ